MSDIGGYASEKPFIHLSMDANEENITWEVSSPTIATNDRYSMSLLSSLPSTILRLATTLFYGESTEEVNATEFHDGIIPYIYSSNSTVTDLRSTEKVIEEEIHGVVSHEWKWSRENKNR
jgi:hypothetical protein